MSHGEAAELRRHGSRANGSLNWAARARVVLEGALICSRSEGGRGRDSPPALTERRMQMSAMKARLRQGVLGNVLAFHSDKDCRCGLESRSLGLVACFHSMRVETPSLSWSRWAKPGIRVSIPCSRAQVSGMPSGEVWHS